MSIREDAHKLIEQYKQARLVENESFRSQPSLWPAWLSQANDLSVEKYFSGQKSKIDNDVNNAILAFDHWTRYFGNTIDLEMQEPKVLKLCSIRYHKWAFKKGRLFVFPKIQVNFGGESKSIKDLNVFNRFIESKGSKIPVIPHIIYLPDMINDKIYSGFAILEKILVPLIHQEYGVKLDALHQQLHDMHASALAKADELIDARLKRSSKDKIKFQDKLYRFLQTTPSLSELPSSFIMDCFQLEPGDLKNLQRFLSMNKGDIDLIDNDDIIQAQNLMKVHKIINS